MTVILVSFGAASADNSNSPPDPPEVVPYKTATRAFRAKYPYVHWYTAWNEPNNRTQSTFDEPFRAGRFFRNLNWQCDTDPGAQCEVAAGDFADYDNLYSTRNTTNPDLA